MFRNLTTAIALCSASMLPAFAETIEVEMLNRGENRESMIFRPDFVRVQPGDTVKFIAKDRGHSAESDTKLWDESVDTFVGKINEEIEYTFENEGLFGVKCKPHYAMGMVMTIAVGDISEAPEGWLEGRIPRKAKQRYEEQLKQLSE